jgi:hypothetical protein
MATKRWSVWYIGVIVCAIIVGIDGILGFINSFSLLGAGWLWGGAALFGILFLVLSVLEIAAAYGLIKLLWWGYVLTIAINVVGIVLSIIIISSFSAALQTAWGLPLTSLSSWLLPYIILPLLVIGYLLIPKTKNLFEAPPE